MKREGAIAREVAAQRRICVVTTTRADYSYYRPILSRIVAASDLDLQLLVTGMHLSPWFGSTVRAIEDDGFPIADRVEMLISGDTPTAIATSMGVGVIGLSHAFGRVRPDILLLLGDRFEMLAAAVAALPFAMPVAHIAGGEATEGAVDDAARHAITKLSHLHFVQAAAYRDRVIQMGEEPWRVIVVGAASLDNLRTLDLLTPDQLEQRFGIKLDPPPLVVTFHPVTLEAGESERHIGELLAALDTSEHPVVFTAPNADASNHPVGRAIAQYVDTHPDARAVTSFGPLGYFSLLKYALAVVGNSSSGIVEAATFELPVVNVGNRQAGRIRGANVVDVECDRSAIAAAIRHVTSPQFRSGLKGLVNPYGDGRASERIVETLRTTALDSRLLVKRFHEIAPL
jgi:UDP-N-acetylglucosamine 2-epimerase (non-hydrolysing)/GDP/UDP-N,N'-diacetylbacillosamine 2-epimerase (hydrolysing)